MAGTFITFEGGEGAGKSTQIKRLAEHLTQRSAAIVVTREPGGAPVAEEIRSILVNGEPGKFSAEAEALLNYAARDAHLKSVIRPALEARKTVLCDRFMDSTRAYQGYAGDCSMQLIDMLEREIVGDTRPSLTFVFDLDPAIGLQRAKSRGHGIEDRYERKGIPFHRKLREGFLAIARKEPQRCIVVDASQPVETVWADILSVVKDRNLG
jgi:dTMP kinase